MQEPIVRLGTVLQVPYNEGHREGKVVSIQQRRVDLDINGHIFPFTFREIESYAIRRVEHELRPSPGQ